jgi:phospholipid/cholesterol/gamma-HCH transport system substrate-binding protein
MNEHTAKYKARLGLFIAVGLGLFIIGIFIIGRQKNLFSPVYKLSTTFYNVSGLQVGCTVRFSGINVGTVDDIRIINDSTVWVDLIIKKDVQRFIKANSEAGIGSSGIIGDRVLVISQGTTESPIAKNGQYIKSKEPTETDAIMKSLQVTADNAAIISDQLAEIMIRVNRGKGTLGKLIQDTTIASNISKTIVNLKKSSKGLDENMNAAKHNFLFRGYFRKQEKAAEKKKADEIQQKKEDQKASDSSKK